MFDNFPFYLAIIVSIVLLIMLSEKIRVAYPVILVLAGLLIGFIPGIPLLHIKPELIFLIFLPPLLYDAAFATSWKELWRWRRIVLSFAFVVVFLTGLCVAIVVNSVIPGMSLALGFLIGGITSPPDAVSAGAILKFVKVPKRMSSILEGESLLNDASSLIIFRFALMAVATGQFIWGNAALSFCWMVVGGVVIGLLIGWLFMKAHKLLPTHVNKDIILSLVTPYVMYIAAEQVHASGILAVVSGGLLLSNRRNYYLTSSARLQGENVWQSLVFILNGLVFMLIGLALPSITEGLKSEGISMSTAIGYGLIVSLVLIVVRFLAAYGAVITTLVASRFITVADPNPGFKAPILLGWTGMRGVVSLAAALSIPVELSDGVPFPHRNLILFITFVTILTTLVLQGLTLPYMIRKVKLPDFNDYLPEEEAMKIIKDGMAAHTLAHIDTHYNQHVHDDIHLQRFASKWKDITDKSKDSEMRAESKQIYLSLLEQQRQWLLERNRVDNKIDEEVIRKFLHQIDLEEEKIRQI